MVQARYIRYPLHFNRPAGTSRGVLHRKECWFIVLTGDEGQTGIGEVSFVPGLSAGDPGDLEIRIDHVCKLISRGEMDPGQSLPSLPGIRFALEVASRDMERGGTRILYPSAFTEGLAGIPTNGLIWMGDRETMVEQIREKLEGGFRVLKMKVGHQELAEEMRLLGWIREEYGSSDLEIRLDANGAWRPEEVPGLMQKLAPFAIHSIEQPIAAGQYDAMAELCTGPAIPIALDEELVGVHAGDQRRELLQRIRPQYIVLKPGLLGGMSATSDWILASGEEGVAWWITSALESNIGLNAIAQWTFQLGTSMPQGLGTGQLYRNNIPSPLRSEGDSVWYRKEHPWDLQSLNL
jgi:O-succinylbenzoate synthase